MRDSYCVAHVEAFVWEPLLPIVMMTANYTNSVTEMTIQEAKQLRKALKKAIKIVEGK